MYTSDVLKEEKIESPGGLSLSVVADHIEHIFDCHSIKVTLTSHSNKRQQEKVVAEDEIKVERSKSTNMIN